MSKYKRGRKETAREQLERGMTEGGKGVCAG